MISRIIPNKTKPGNHGILPKKGTVFLKPLSSGGDVKGDDAWTSA